ncbi:high-affinity choline transporter 1-like [Lycorma delicatula]|uniref:high-affinity choline transporter 1-like n=1 Tax=Lycorma delicatula TaxID=130591 RepID=UPI003F51822C
MAVFVAGLIGIIVFYIIILAIGVLAGTKQKGYGEDEVLLAGRSFGYTISALTLMATWVGGDYISAISEIFFTSGLLWCQVPIGYSLSLVIGSLLFVKPMREANYITVLDPFQQKYGERIGGLLFLPALFGDVLWIASILSSLGSFLRVILDINTTSFIIITASFAASYTAVGGIYSVAYTDCLQIFAIFIGLMLCTPFAYYDSPFKDEWINSSTDWIGKIKLNDFGVWIDGLLLLIFGGLSWQGYFQRILCIKSTKIAQTMGIAAVFGCLLIAVPAAFIGVMARNVDWDNVPNFNRTITKSNDANIILPLVIKYLTPAWVSLFGLGAVSASVMSSIDSSILASSSMFSRNIYKMIFKPVASDKEVLWVQRGAIVGISIISAIIAITVDRIHCLTYLCSDLLYITIFPQLLLVVHWPFGATRYGCLVSYIVGLILRILGGEKGIGIPVTIYYPWYDHKTEKQLFPFKTFTMLISLFFNVIISRTVRWLFETGVISADQWDFLYDFPECHFTKNEQPKETRHKEGIKGRSNKAVHDAILGKRWSQTSDDCLIKNDDDRCSFTKHDRYSITYQTSTTSEEPSICIQTTS